MSRVRGQPKLKVKHVKNRKVTTTPVSLRHRFSKQKGKEIGQKILRIIKYDWVISLIVCVHFCFLQNRTLVHDRTHDFTVLYGIFCSRTRTRTAVRRTPYAVPYLSNFFSRIGPQNTNNASKKGIR